MTRRTRHVLFLTLGLSCLFIGTALILTALFMVKDPSPAPMLIMAAALPFLTLAGFFTRFLSDDPPPAPPFSNDDDDDEPAPPHVWRGA